MPRCALPTQGVHDAVVELGIADSTYMMFTSDHGYHLGQFHIRTVVGFPSWLLHIACVWLCYDCHPLYMQQE